MMFKKKNKPISPDHAMPATASMTAAPAVGSTPPMPVVKPAKPRKKGLRAFIWRWCIAPLLVLFISFHLLVAGLLIAWQSYPATNSMFMLTHRLSGGTVSHSWVDYDDIARSVKQAAVASEDAKFVSHNGFDMDGIERAMRANEKAGAVSMGGSTITQQLAKNLFLTSHRSYIRKGEEAIITVMIENMWDKRRILEVYLNVVEFGDGIYGIQAAAEHYFNTSAKNLSREQAALLISMLPNPKYYQKNRNNKRLKNKQRIIMARMSSAHLPK